MEERAAHPEYGKPLSGAPNTVDGVTFRPYRTGIARTARVSDDFRAEVRDAYPGSGYWVRIDGVNLTTTFRHRDTAYAAAVKALRKPTP